MNEEFKIHSPHKPTGDQPVAIEKLVKGLAVDRPFQVLLGATGTGKTFTIANVIERVQRPTLVLVHNKTLAGQLYAEFKELFPENRVEYFVSNFDFYQPEAYMPKSDTYIEKTAMMNEEIEMLRTSAINSILERRDTIIVSSVASIYGLSDPKEYQTLSFTLRVGETIDRRTLFKRLVDAQYQRNNLDLPPGNFRVRGDVIEIAVPGLADSALRIDTFGDEIERIALVDLLTAEVRKTYKIYPIYPAYAHASTKERVLKACEKIEIELQERLAYFRSENKLLEAQRLELRTRQDIESLQEFGMCPGIENYSRHIDGRKEGERPFCLMDYFPDDFLYVIDESHVSIPQVRGMYNGDRARKQTLVEYGFRLPSALDNRPLKFDEFEHLLTRVICTTATPGDYELARTQQEVVEQIIRPTGLIDPVISVRPTVGQIDDLMFEITERIKKNQRVMIVTLTIKMAEDLTSFLKNRQFKVVYMHSETKTLERTDIIYQLRKGKYDILIGINLLREGLDIPEVSLIAILDADKEGFLRSTRSLIQIVGRAARNVEGKVIMYADKVTRSMKETIEETDRRRSIQIAYNSEHGITPKTIVKELHSPMQNQDEILAQLKDFKGKASRSELLQRVKEFEKLMKEAAKQYDFEKAAELRDIIFELKAEIGS
jgi:excinuclease ABC subunit B